MSNGTLVAYYSWHGNTRKIAELISRPTGATLFEIEPVQPYSTDYEETLDQAKQEIQGGVRPEIKAVPEAASCNVVFVGTPIWCGTMAPPVATFMDRLDLGGKTVVPFYTHGGGGGGSFESDLANMCPGSNVPEALCVHNAGGAETAKQIDEWLSSIGLQP